MRIAILSSTTFPAALFDDPDGHVTFYGSEIYNSYLCQMLAEEGHEVEWYAPIMSSTFREYPNIHYHPIRNSYGAHLPSELLEDICFEHGSQTTDLLKCDFVIDMSKQAHCIEELYYYNKLRRFLCYRSGHQDHVYPTRLNINERHYIVPNKSFVKLFNERGVPADYVQHFIPDFWHPGEDAEYWKYWEDKGLERKSYYLFPHRCHPHKGLNVVIRLAKNMPDTNFVFSTSTPLPDHIENWNQAHRECVGLSNVKFIQAPMTNKYHFYRRELGRGAKAILCPFEALSYYQGGRGGIYHDMGGYVALENAKMGVPLIMADTEGSRVIFGDECDGKSLLYIDGYNGAKLAIENFDSYNLVGEVAPGWTRADTLNKYMELIKKYS